MRSPPWSRWSGPNSCQHRISLSLPLSKNTKNFILVFCFHLHFNFMIYILQFTSLSPMCDTNEATQCVGKFDSLQYSIWGWKSATHKVEAILWVTLMPGRSNGHAKKHGGSQHWLMLQGKGVEIQANVNSVAFEYVQHAYKWRQLQDSDPNTRETTQLIFIVCIAIF